MKVVIVGVVFAAALIGVVAYQEGRIAKLRAELKELKEEPVPLKAASESNRAGGSLAAISGGPQGKSGRVKVTPGGPGGGAPNEGDTPESKWIETFREMSENPVGAAMLKEEQKARALRVYGDFIDSLNLDKKEREYFLGLVASGVGEEDTVGMKLFAAENDEERVKILDQMEADQKARKEAVKDFLNSDEDFARYEHFEARKDIYEQMPGLNAALKDVGAPIDEVAETKLVDAIYEASVKSGMDEAWTGRRGMEQFGVPGATQRFAEQWGQMQGVLQKDVGAILDDPKQREVFDEHQNQIAKRITFGLQFVENMISNQQNAPPGRGN